MSQPRVIWSSLIFLLLIGAFTWYHLFPEEIAVIVAPVERGTAPMASQEP